MPNSAKSNASHVIYIASKEYTLTRELVPLGKVTLDPDNPRLRQRIQAKYNSKAPTQEQIRDIILDLPSVPELQADIRASKGLLEPIYVNSEGLIVEGNCRMAVYMKLSETPDQHWKKIPIYRFPANVGKREQAIFQAKYHITSGKNPWDPYEKANHIYHMHTALGMTIKEISGALYPRMHQDTIQRNLDTYREFTAGHLGLGTSGTSGGSKGPSASHGSTSAKAPTSKEGKTKPARSKKTTSKKTVAKSSVTPTQAAEPSVRAWSYYDEFYRRKELEPYRKTDDGKKWFADLVLSGKLGPAQNVRHLATILATPGAKTILAKDGFDEAMKIVMKHDPTAGSPLFKLLTQAVESLGRFEHNQIARLKKEVKQQSIIRTLHDKLADLAAAADIELEGHDS